VLNISRFAERGGLFVAWIFLMLAGIFEVVWAIGLKYSQGFTRLYPSIVTIVGMLISFYLLSVAIRTLPIGTAYAVWTGIGAVGAVIFGIFFFNEPVNASRIIFLCLILIGIIGLKITSGNF
jgi:quaternary ammonium compound-resistance protein SugE